MLVYFEYRNEILFFWVGAAVFVVGSVLDILDGALARAGGKQTPFGAFIDSTTDRASEAFMLGAIALVFMRDAEELGVALTAPRSRARSSSATPARGPRPSGLRGDVGIGSRAERVVVITAGLVLAPWGGLPWAIGVLAATAWFTVAPARAARAARAARTRRLARRYSASSLSASTSSRAARASSSACPPRSSGRSCARSPAASRT